MTINTEHNVNDIVFIMYNNKIVKVKIIGIVISNNNTICAIKYDVQSIGANKNNLLGYHRENEVFKTKEDLFESL